MTKVTGTISQKGVSGTITQKGVTGSIVESGVTHYPPVYVSSEVGLVASNTLVVTFDRALNVGYVPDDTDFVLSFSGGAVTVTGVFIYDLSPLSTYDVTLILSRDIAQGETGNVTYTPGISPITGTNGDPMTEGFSGTVTNNVVGTIPLFVSGVVEDAQPTKVVLTYDQTLDGASVPATTDFTVTDHTISGVAIVGATVELTLTVEFYPSDVCNVTYTKGINPIQADAGKLDAADLGSTLITNNVTDWNLFGQGDLAFWSNNRSGLNIVPSVGSNAIIIPVNAYFNGAYFLYNDSNSLDLGDVSDWTLGVTVKQTADVGADQLYFGKPCSNGTKVGTYEFWCYNTTKRLYFSIQTSTGWHSVDYGIAALNANKHLSVVIDNTAKTLTGYIDGIQSGDPVSFTGNINSPSKPIQAGAGQRYNSATYDKPMTGHLGCAYIYKSKLTPAQITQLVAGTVVASSELFWVFDGGLAWDISGNGHSTYRTTAAGTVAKAYVNGHPALLNNGYSYFYRYSDNGYFLVPKSGSSFVVNCSPVPSYSDYAKLEDVDGDSNYLNISVDNYCRILFPDGVLDRSNATIFNDACRSASDYDASRPTLWDIANLSYNQLSSFLNENVAFTKYDKSPVIGRHLLQEVIVYNTAIDASNIDKVKQYCNSYHQINKFLTDGNLTEWAASGYYYNGKHYRTWVKDYENNYDKYIYTIDDNLDATASYLAATGVINKTDHHSRPSCIVGNDGYIYVVHEEMNLPGTHGTNLLIYKSNSSEDITAGFAQLQRISGEYCYPQFVKSDGGLFIFCRESGTGENVNIIKQDSGTGLFSDLGRVVNSTGKSYKYPVKYSTDKLRVIWYKISVGESVGVYYAESEDGIVWANIEGTYSIDMSESEEISDLNKSNYLVYGDSVSYNSILSEDSIVINGNPVIVVYEGNYAGEVDGVYTITVDNVLLMQWNGSAWVKNIFSSTPFLYGQRVGFFHHLMKKGGTYYIFYLDSLESYDIIRKRQGSNLSSMGSAEILAKADIGDAFGGEFWSSTSDDLTNQIMTTMVYKDGLYWDEIGKIHFSYKL